jgi:hypothetical protein
MMNTLYPHLTSHAHGMFYDPWSSSYELSYRGSKFVTATEVASKPLLRTLSEVELEKLRRQLSIKRLTVLSKSVVTFYDPIKTVPECWVAQRTSVDPALLEIPEHAEAGEEPNDGGSPQAHEPPRFRQISLHFECHALETGVFSTDIERFNSFLHEVRKFILESHDRRTRIQAYTKLFHPSCLDSSFLLGREDLAKAKKELFDLLPLDFQEDVKYALWRACGSLDTLGSDHGRWLFEGKLNSDVVREAVNLAARRPRYCSKSDDETLEEQYATCLNLADTLKTSRTTLSELYVYQGFEIANAHRMVDTARLVDLFFHSIQKPFQDRVFSTIKAIDGLASEDEAKANFASNPLSNTALRAIRALKHDRIIDFNSRS